MPGRRIVIFGPGRVGRNFAAYARALGHEARLVTRAESGGGAQAREALVAKADLVAAAIPDDALATFAQDWRALLAGKTAIHFSGALTVPGLRGYHPLYSFPKSELPIATLKSIAIAREEHAPRFAEILPGADNPEFVVAAKDRAFYHALAVLSGNFAAHLWNETARAFEDRLGSAPSPVLANYFASLVERFAERPFDSLTGPIARKDRASVEANLAALAGEPKLKALYEAFLRSAWPDF